jgi:cytochrome c oxidase subunit IV
MSDLPHGGRRPLRTEALIFVGAAVFFAVIAVIYGLLTTWEPVGATALFLLAGLGGLTGIYLLVLGNRIDPRPEDDPFADIEVGAGEVGVFSPWSWWPLVLGIATALLFLGLAVGAWVAAIGAVLAVIGLVGLVYEFSRGQHAH